MSLAGCLCAGAALGQSAAPFSSFQQDKEEPILVEADSLEIDQNINMAVFRGNVVIIQGDLRMSGDVVEVFYTETEEEPVEAPTDATVTDSTTDEPTDDGIERILATGNVSLISETETVEADQGDYNVEDGMLIMTGNVRMVQDRNILSSNRAEIDIENGRGQFTGRVRSVFTPSGDN
ncbi:lipopolysaccharide export system protein LptA [Rubricella aquisinus]|uniref:Lipopolysaccharide export system protein LptA n=1 Tax=Rubricella aquisinus TaxID=2028108 RepID=A0A840WT67_9RHOB|nr:LptA/OstA family protein [Rubricella aquisinus]MBB5514390.1 lipopolysaccharide export system protein LptA [Rubricella aquisinus]